MRPRFNETEVNDRLFAEGLTASRDSVDKLSQALTEAGIHAAVASADRARDAVGPAQDVAEAVHMSFADSVV